MPLSQVFATMGEVARIGGGKNEIDLTSKRREQNWVMGHGRTRWGPFSHLSSIVSFLKKNRKIPFTKLPLFLNIPRQIMAGTKFAKMKRSKKWAEKKWREQHSTDETSGEQTTGGD